MASTHLCQPRETEDTLVPAVKWCTECEENLCKDCFQFHKKLKLLQTKEEASSIDVCQKLDKIEIHFPKRHELPSSSFFGDVSIKKTPLNIHAKFSKAQVAETIRHNDSVKTLHHNSTNEFRSPIRGIAITKNNDFLICGDENSTVLRCFSNGTVDTSCKVDSQTFNICVIDETDEAVVTLPFTGKIQFIKYITMEASKTVDTFPHPWGITLCKDKLVVWTFNKMQFFTIYGSPLHYVDVTCVDSTAICFMYQGDKNQMYESCRSFYGITEDGKLLSKHSARFNRRTNGICIDRDGSIYVASQNSVVRLSKEGTVLDKDILDESKQYGDIWGIDFNRTYTHMYAASNNGLQLTVFDFK